MEEGKSNLVRRWGRRDNIWDNLDVGENNDLRLVQETEQWDSEVEKKKKALLSASRGLIRSVVLILDLSTNGLEQRAFNQNRMKLIQDLTIEFINDFFVQNPLSQLSILATYESTCHILTPLSCNVDDHIHVVKKISQTDHSGEPSLENSLSIATAILGNGNQNPGLAQISTTKEVLIVYGSLTTCDNSPIFKTLNVVKNSKIKVSIIGLGAKVFVLERIAQESGGDYFVPVSIEHLHDIFHSFVIPPEYMGNQRKYYIPFGFASIANPIEPAFDVFKLMSNPPGSTNKPETPQYGGYNCPRCGTRVFSIPCFCPVCRDFLISPAYLKRTVSHLNPIPPFVEDENPQTDHCFGCNAPFYENEKPCRCTKCNHYFCKQCDPFIHEILQRCPGCTD